MWPQKLVTSLYRVVQDKLRYAYIKPFKCELPV